MKNIMLFLWVALCVSLGLLGSMGCGGGETGVLSIIPAGPTIVLKGNTLPFTSNIAGTTFSVVGGDANGTINAKTGLYTPPATLPIEPQITVMGSFEGQTATALVDLRTGDTMAFGAAQQVNGESIPDSLTILNEFLFGGLSDRIGVRLNSIHINSTWIGLNTDPGPRAEIYFNQNVDFAGFGQESNLSMDSTSSQMPTSIDLDSKANPGIIFVDNSDGMGGTQSNWRLGFLGSADQGSTFTIEALIDDSNPGSTQVQGASRFDGQDNLHVAFVDAATDTITDPLVKYARSNDGGATWEPSVPVGNPFPASHQSFPQVAVDPAGNNVFVCWTDDRGMGLGTSDIFLSISTNGGANFNTPIPITTSGTAVFCRVARGPEGEIYVSYADEGSDVDPAVDVFLVKSTDGGANFGNPVQVNTNSTNVPLVTFPFLAVDSLGRIDLVWPGRAAIPDLPPVLRYARSVNGGASFSPDVQIAGGAMSSVLAAMGLRHDDSGRLHLQYWDNANAASMTHNIFYMMAE